MSKIPHLMERQNTLDVLEVQEKHKKYKTAYKPNDFYWGLGVEHETYLETAKFKQISLKGLKENKKPERYSVNYYNIYTQDAFNTAVDSLFKDNDKILIPILVNSHTFQKTDIYEEHKTTYEKIPKPNPKFSQKTVFEWIKEHRPSIFADEFDKSYTFDGDTIEFMTQNFYKATVDSVIDELSKIETAFVHELNLLPEDGIFKKYGKFKIAQENYPFATYLTNLKNNAMFNNGTIHINITLPTKLDNTANIADVPLFTKQHQNLARVLQWISPLLVAKYGASDPLSNSCINGDKFSAGSQRVAVSRYIGLGTFDTDSMPSGKILNVPKDSLKNIQWYESFYKNVEYKMLNELGLDINFNKHYCHGIEFRILDSLPIPVVKEVLTLIVYLADFSLTKNIESPSSNKVWHTIAEHCVHYGKGYMIDVFEQNTLYTLFGISYLSKEPAPILDVFETITEYLYDTYKDSICVNYMIKGVTCEPELNQDALHLYSIPEKPDECDIESSTSSEITNNELLHLDCILDAQNKDDRNKDDHNTTEINISQIQTSVDNNKWWCC